jgi:hypothetical protein
MALPTAATIENLTRCKTLPGFFPGGFTDQFVRRIAFEDVTGYGPAVQINRATLGAAANYSAGGAMGNVAGAAALTQFVFQRIGDTVEVDSADIVASEESQQQLELQVEMKKVSLIRQLGNQLIQGSGVAPNLTGLALGVDATQTIDPAGGVGTAPTLADYHRLVARVAASDRSVGIGADALVMHPRTRRQLISVLEAAAGGGPQYCEDESLGHPVLMFEGLPVYVSENVSTTETAAGVQTGGVLTSVFALKLEGPTAVRLLHQGGSTSEFGIMARLRAIDIAAFPD